MERGRKVEIAKLVSCIILCQVAGILGSIFTKPAILSWYGPLKKPFFTPPNWVFAPVWVMLYVLMGVAAFLVWRKGFQQKQTWSALVLFGIQLILNVLWSVMFFGLRSPIAGLIEISILALVVLLTIQSFLQVTRVAGLLLVPYFLWVAFASGLNLSIWVLNR